MLWTFDCEEKTWSRVKATFIRVGNEEPKFDYSMQIAVAAALNKVYLIGGSKDRHFNNWVDYVREWDLAT
jgi:hypothetical protein